jgi:MHS family alpha-ketoglutarate permease-like MFS transporter
MGGLKLLLQHPRECLIVVGLTMGGTLAFYVYTTYMQKFLKLSVGLTDAQTTAVSAGSLVFAALLQPLYGALSDRSAASRCCWPSRCWAPCSPCRC